MKLLRAFPSVWKVRQSHFKNCRGTVQFVETGSGIRNVRQNHLNHSGGPVHDACTDMFNRREGRKSYFNHCGGAVQLVQTSSGIRKVQESHSNHCGGPVMLVQTSLIIGKVGKSHFNLCAGPMKIVPLWRTYEAPTSLSVSVWKFR